MGEVDEPSVVVAPVVVAVCVFVVSVLVAFALERAERDEAWRARELGPGEVTLPPTPLPAFVRLLFLLFDEDAAGS